MLKNAYSSEVKKILQNFVDGSIKNQWFSFYGDRLSVYLRLGVHLVSGELLNTLDIANVSVIEDSQEQGLFTTFLGVAESLNKTLYIENILTERFMMFFKNRGYAIYSQDIAIWIAVKEPKYIQASQKNLLMATS